MPKARINGLPVHYQQHGEGPDLVLIHGLFCNLAFWYLSVVPALAEHFRVTVYDLRGHGFTGGTDRGYRAVDLADDLRALLDHLGIRRAHVVGHSYGGAVALAFALRHDNCVTSLTLADAWIPSLQAAPLGRNPRDMNEKLKASGIEIEGELPKVAYGLLEELATLQQTEGAKVPAVFDGFGSPISGQRGSLIMRRWLQLVRTTAAVEEFNDGAGLGAAEIECIKRPVRAMFGGRSRYLPTLRALQRHLPDCHAEILPNMGHFFPILRPGEFSQAVIRSVAVTVEKDKEVLI